MSEIWPEYLRFITHPPWSSAAADVLASPPDKQAEVLEKEKKEIPTGEGKPPTSDGLFWLPL